LLTVFIGCLQSIDELLASLQIEAYQCCVIHSSIPEGLLSIALTSSVALILLWFAYRLSSDQSFTVQFKLNSEDRIA